MNLFYFPLLLYTDASIMTGGKNLEDKELVSRIKTGDKSAFDELYDKYHLSLYRNAYLITGRQQDAEDVLQETFLTSSES